MPGRLGLKSNDKAKAEKANSMPDHSQTTKRYSEGTTMDRMGKVEG